VTLLITKTFWGKNKCFLVTINKKKNALFFEFTEIFNIHALSLWYATQSRSATAGIPKPYSLTRGSHKLHGFHTIYLNYMSCHRQYLTEKCDAPLFWSQNNNNNNSTIRDEDTAHTFSLSLSLSLFLSLWQQYPSWPTVVFISPFTSKLVTIVRA